MMTSPNHLINQFHFGPWFDRLSRASQKKDTSRDYLLATMANNLLASIQSAGFCRQNPFVAATLHQTSPDHSLTTGVHRGDGTPHAERELYQKTEAQQISWKNGHLFCSLPPCQHLTKKTPPCLPLILERGLQQLSVCDIDANPATAQLSLLTLRQQFPKLNLNVGLWRQAQQYLNRVFYFQHRITQKKRPYIHLKMALSLDGSWQKIQPQAGEKNNITCSATREWVHYLRAQYSAVAVGANTYRRDQPLLNVRLPGFSSQPSFLQPQSIVFTHSPPNISTNPMQQLKPYFCFVDPQDPAGLSHALAQLQDMGLTSILVEGGPNLMGQFLDRELFDEISIFIAPKLLGSPEKLLLKNREYFLSKGQWIPCYEDLWYHYVQLCLPDSLPRLDS